MLRRTKTIVFRDDDESEEKGFLPQRPSLLRKPLEPVGDDYDTGPAAAASPAKEQQSYLRSELDENPITKGSPHSLEALRAEFQRTLQSRVDDGSANAAPTLPGFLKPSRILLILVALVAGGTAAYLALQRPAEPAPEAIVEQAAPVVEVIPMTQVLVASKDIGMGQRLTDEMLQWQEWPTANVRPEFITSEATPEAITDMGGSVARSEILAGEPIRAEKLGQAGQGFLSGVLEGGKRGVSFNIRADSASGGFVVPNDRVDVVLTRQTPAGDQVSQTILHNVRVLAINAQLGATEAEAETATPESGLFSDNAIATLELDPSQAELLINASGMGSLSLMLRPITDATKAPTAGESAINQSIRLSSPFWRQ